MACMLWHGSIWCTGKQSLAAEKPSLREDKYTQHEHRAEQGFCTVGLPAHLLIVPAVQIAQLAHQAGVNEAI